MNKRNIFVLIIVLLIWNIILTVLIVNNNQGAKQTVTEENVYGISTDLTKVAKECYSSVVSVSSSYGKQSGFIYKQEDNKAYIITTYHGIINDQIVSVGFANGKNVTGTVIGYDNVLDVAVILIDSQYLLNVVKCGDNDYTNNGEFIICINANNNESLNDVELGIVSNSLISIEDTITIKKDSFNIQKEMIGLSLKANAGYSGSPIFNMKNEVLGMVQMSDEERTYSLTINEIKIIVDNIINETPVNKIDMGIKGKYISNLEDYERNMLNIPFEIISGYYVSDVDNNSIAYKLGLQQGDIINSINGNVIKTQKDLLNSLYSVSNEQLILSVYRLDQLIELKGNLDD